MSVEVIHKVSEQRSRNMSAIKSKNTKPEIKVRKVLHSMGYRFRLHSKDLDLVHLSIKYSSSIKSFLYKCYLERNKKTKTISHKVSIN